MTDQTFVAASTDGELRVRLSDGVVTGRTIRDPEFGTDLGSIERFDLGEFRRRYPDRGPSSLDTIDVRDLAYWTSDGELHEPDEEWRSEREELRAEIENGEGE